MHILLVENDGLDQNASLLASLKQGGYEVCLAHTPTSAAHKTLSMWPNLIVLNSAHSLNLIAIKAAIDQTDLDVPCIVVGSINQKLAFSNNNIILVDPNQNQDLDQSIQHAVVKQEARFLRLPDLTIDLKKRCILRGDKTFSLTPKEFKLLQLLLDHKNQILKRRTIMQEVWQTDYMGDTRTLDVHIRWLRQKIEARPSKPKYLRTVRGVGYRFSTDFV